jgi:periplasmic protein TonB
MFDSVLSKSGAPQGNIAGLALSGAIFGAVVAVALVMPKHVAKTIREPVDVTLFRAASPPPPPPPPPAASGATASTSPKPVTTVRKREPRKPILAPILEKVPDPLPEPVAEPAPSESAAAPAAGGVPGGTPGGVAGGTLGGVVGGTLGGTVGGRVQAALPFGAGMTRPTQIAGEQPEYTREAIAARVEGKVLVRCVITSKGAIEDCKLIKGVPMLDKIAIDALRASRFTPVTYQGRAEAVQYLFTFNFKLP